jgi:hypothetical protein
VLARLQRWSGLSLDEAQAVSAVPALLPAVWYSSQPTVGLLLVRIVERTWNMAPAGLVEAVTPSQLGGKAKDVIDHWIRIELVDTDNQPVSGEAYKVALPDGVIREGRLDDQGRAMIGGIRVGGPCKVCFPQIDGQEWRAL